MAGLQRKERRKEYLKRKKGKEESMLKGGRRKEGKVMFRKKESLGRKEGKQERKVLVRKEDMKVRLGRKVDKKEGRYTWKEGMFRKERSMP